MAKKPEDDDIDLKIEDAPDPVVEIKVAEQDDKPEIGEPPPGPVGADEGIETLKSKLAESERNRLASEARERDANLRLGAAGREVQDTQLSLVNNAIATLNEQQDRIEADMAQAAADGDWLAHSKLGRTMNENAVKLQTLEGGKLSLEAQAKEEPAPAGGDPIENWITENNPGAASANWLRQHPEYLTNPNLYQRMLAAHTLTVGDGIAPNTDGYFESVETILKIRKPEAREEESALSEASRPTGRSSPPAAPVSRGAGGNGSAPTVMRLTQQEREQAAAMDQTPEEYARNKLALIKEGRMQ